MSNPNSPNMTDREDRLMNKIEASVNGYPGDWNVRVSVQDREGYTMCHIIRSGPELLPLLQYAQRRYTALTKALKGL